jgi:hypothetical protein
MVMKTMIYALISFDDQNSSPDIQNIKGINGGNLEIISTEKIGAVVCKTDNTDFAVDKIKAIEFAYVIESLSNLFNLLPVRFGSIMESTEAIAGMLERNKTQILHNLLNVTNKSEFGIKVMCDTVALKAELNSKSKPDLSSEETPESENTPSVFRSYVEKKLKEHRIEEMILTYADEVISEITITLESLNTSFKFKKMVSEKTLIDAIFLIDKQLKKDLIQTVTNLQNKYPALSFILTGPWPPYNFVELNLK